jgi:hypothetical protein
MKNKALSDNDIDNRLKEALAVLGMEPGQTVEGNAAIGAAREFLSTLSIALIKAEVERENGGASSFWPDLRE